MTKYARIRGRVLGPFDDMQISEMIRQGKIGLHTEISDDGKTWIKASETSLFTVAPRQAAVRRGPSQESEGLSVNTDDDVVIRSGKGVAEWFLSNDGITGTGPYSVGDVLAMLESQKINENTLAWKQGGMAKPLRQIPEISDNIAAPEPIPTSENFDNQMDQAVSPVEQAACPFCGKTISPGAIFCIYCGKEQPKTIQKPRDIVKRCPECNTPVDSSVSNCPRCGAQIPVQECGTKSMIVYMLLAIFLGIFGVHNFYAGYKTNAILQLLFTFSLFGIIVSFIWGLRDAFTIKEDCEGFSFR